jgi:hypothetical protein
MMQWSKTINLSFTYRFNKPKTKEKPTRKMQNDGGDYQG